MLSRFGVVPLRRTLLGEARLDSGARYRAELLVASHGWGACRPHVITRDPMVYAAPIVAHGAGLPRVALSSSLNSVLPEGFDSELLSTVRALEPARARLFAAHGLEASSPSEAPLASSHRA